MLPEQQQRILGYFIEEAKDHLNTIEQGLLNLQSTLDDPEAVNEVFRAAHSIKGGAAMLGLSSIQHTSHRLEDCFKVLKEHPVQVDQKLESLFLAVSDTLKALLEQLQGPFGLSEETANDLMSEAEPVFKWLHEHLEVLVIQQSSGVANGQGASKDAPPQLAPTSGDSWQNLQTQVIKTLREMLQLFKQTATPETRQNLYECCHELARLGEEFNWSHWCSLCWAAGSAIKNPENTYLTLAKIVITDIKQSLELLLAGREAEIAISQQLEALIGVEAEIELLEISLDLVDEPADTSIESSDVLQSTITITNDSTSADQVLPTSDAASPEVLEFEPLNSITSLYELSGSFNDALITNTSIDTNGPEVGIAELNTLADLFEGESPDLDGTWEQEEILDFATANNFGIDLSNSDTKNAESEFEFLFEEISSDKRQTKTAKEEPTLAQLFGEFLEFENLEQQHQNAGFVLEFSSDNIVAPDDDITLTPTQSNRSHLTVTSENIQDQVTSLLDLTVASENIQDQVSSLSDLVLDENEPLLTGEVTQLETETNNRRSLSTNIESSFDDLFIESANPNPVEEIAPGNHVKLNITPPLGESLTLEELFAETEEDTSLAKYDGNSTFGDLLDPLPATTLEFSPQDDDLSNFWEQQAEAGEQDKMEQDAAKALEEILHDAVAADDIFGEEQPLTSTTASLYLEDLDINFQGSEHQIDLLFSLDDVDDLFEELAASVDNSEVSPQEIRNFSQPPEALELTPEFTNLSTDVETHIEIIDTEIITRTQTVADLFDLGDDLLAAEIVEPEEVIPEQVVEQTNCEESTLQADTSTTVPAALNYHLDAELDDYAVTNDEISANVIPLGELDQLDEYLQQLTDAQAADLAELFEEVHTGAAVVPTTEETTTSEEIEENPLQNDADLQDEFAELDDLLKQKVPQSASAVSIPENQIAALEELLNLVPNQVALDAGKGDIDIQFQELEEMVKGDLLPRPPVSRAPRFEQLMKVPVKHLDDLSNLVGELVVNRNTLEQDQERLGQSLDNLLHQVQQLSDVGARMQELYERSLLEASLLKGRKNKVSEQNSDTDRGFSELEMDRFTPFHTLSQHMIELIVRVRESASDIDFVTEEQDRVARQFRQVTSQLQEGITRARMEPFAEVTTPLERGVRESAIKCGKQAHLTIQGRDTLIDKMILEHLKSPLTHLLNNAIAHGIETPQARQAASKPLVGAITVRAFHQGNQTVISVGDDGAGIDTEFVKAKAIKMGIMTPEQAKSMSRLEVYDLLFQPGFSTKDKEDELAGRGVGLDVVRTRISEIRGTINIDSTVGKGTTFTIRLPLTLSICKALCCVSDKARIAFPMDGVEDTLDVPVKNIQTGADGQKFIYWRDTVLPFRPLKELLTFNRQLSRGNVYGGNRDDDMVSVVVMRSANILIALQVDLVLNEQEIVIKQFEGPAPKPIGVAGATVLGDGRVMPIADVLEIIDIFQGRTSKQRGVSLWEQKGTPVVTEAAVKIDPTVLIVDDSITVRELLSLTFNKAGYRVEQARDGQEAWDKLRSGLPCDIVFCDIEMPRCDGLELLSRIQKDPNLNNLPIAMLTSRGADKHRQMAIQLGASGYFTKPYLEEALLEAASRMLKGEKLVVPTP